MRGASLWAGWGSTHSGVTKGKKDAFVNDAPWFERLQGEPPCPSAFAQAVPAAWATLTFGVIG